MNKKIRFQTWVWKNVSNEVLFSMIQISSENSKLFWSMCSGRVTPIHRSFPLLFKDKGLKDIGHSMRIGNLILGVNSVMVSFYYKMQQLFNYNMRQKFITKYIRFSIINLRVLLQDVIVITNCDDFILKCNVHYKLKQCSQYKNVDSYLLRCCYSGDNWSGTRYLVILGGVFGIEHPFSHAAPSQNK